MRTQAEHFGTQTLQGDVTRVDLQKRPFTIQLADGRRVIGGDADHRDRCVGALARHRVRSPPVRSWRVDLCDL